MTDEQLIASYQDGNDESCELLIQRYLQPIYRYVFRMLNDVNDAEDVTQQIFIKMWQSLGRFRATSTFKTWLYRIARNATIDWLRRKKHIVFSDLDTDDGRSVLDTLVDQAPLPDEIVMRLQDTETIERILNTLPSHYREVLLLHYQEGFTFEEIGQVMKKPMNTVKSHYYRALRQLRQLLGSGSSNAPVHQN